MFSLRGGRCSPGHLGWRRAFPHLLFCPGIPQAKVKVVERSDGVMGFKERTFAWLMRHCRLERDYEATESSAEAWIYLAMIRRLT